MSCSPSSVTRRTFSALAAAAAASVLLGQFDPALGQMPELKYQQLPIEVRSYAEKVRESCKELDAESAASDQMQGITVIDLAGDGSRDLMVDAEHLCNSWMKGANCSNRGCDLKIWKQVGQQSWRKVFDEHLHRKFISLSETGRFRSMSISVYAGDPHCQPVPGKNYTSGQSCDVTVDYRAGRWVWKKIP